MEANFNYRGVEASIVPRLMSDPSDQGNSNTETNVQTVTLASPLNGQFYVIGSPSDLLGAASTTTSSAAQRSIAPRTLTLEAAAAQLAANKQLDLKELTRAGVGGITDKIAREEKLGNRRATHNEVERRRRDNINHWIIKLGKLIPQEPEEDPLTMNGNKQALSKGGILAKACEYLTEMRETNNYLRESLAEKEEILADNERLHSENNKLQLELAQLRSQLNQINQIKPSSSMLSSGGGGTDSLLGDSDKESSTEGIIKQDINFGL